MEKETLQLGNDLIASFFTDALQTLLPSPKKDGSQCIVTKGESARTQRYALFHDGKTRKGVDVYFNRPFVKAVMESHFPESSVDVSDVEQPFIQYVVSQHIDAWLKKLSLVKETTSDETVEYYFSMNDFQVALTMPKSIEALVFEHHLKLDTKKRLSTQQASGLLQNQPVELSLTLPKVKVSLEDVLNLKPGDKIRSERRIDAGLALNVEEHTVVRNVFVSYKEDKASIVVGNI